MRGGLAAQIAMYVTLVAVVVCAILAVGTIGFAGASFSQLMVDHGETVATAQQMFRDSVAGVFAVALVFALAAGGVLAVAVGRRVGAPLREISVAARLVAQGDHDVRVRESG